MSYATCPSRLILIVSTTFTFILLLEYSSIPVMQRLQSFLPAMEQSTNELQQRTEADPSGLDIEQLNPETQEYIEMASETRPGIILNLTFVLWLELGPWCV